ncbi:acyl-CoA dehydrogenase NM domain-like protein [Suillus fuscotomentosus]|uniref:Acyl-CoA dehydrogenase NM domain-like protein n=1 Tax=Suillus fuscotomentosus TaxID=1912939 RepID=A0AAD4HJN6_9AGAM|nr:acyl-CoA dehydrogenase NM domain-like protein [Suillus fuscotomentosus]KAG1900135.1 acyl-CoA dehydrogenase NM domain-like protein [Suillus fuscotomentosus]
MTPTSQLCQSDLFKKCSELLSSNARVVLSYERAKAIGLALGITLNDTLNLTQKFWDIHTDPIIVRDGAATTLVTIQYNLVAGTLAKYAATTRPDLVSLVEDILRWDVIGQFCLTELGRGLDIFRMKTSATLLPTGEFDLHTPSPSDAKFMPPTIPVKGLPCVGVVFAQLYVDGECRGPRPFIVNLNDGYDMCNGVTSMQMLLPPRGGSSPVNHALTSFHHVRLPPSALLGDLTKSDTIHRDFMSSIWRVMVGSLALSSLAIPYLQVGSFVAARYFQRRHVTSLQGNPMPIISYRTQQLPLLHAIAQAFVLRALHKWAVEQFMDQSIDVRVRHGIAACCKAVMLQHAQVANYALSERLGAQGLFEYNQLSNFYSEVRGISIAEGDTLALSMRLVADTLSQTYELPFSTHPDGSLAMHEISLFDEATETVSSSSDFTQAFMQYVQPRCQQMVESMGHRMAYDAAVDQGISQYLVNLYNINAIKTDAAWYVEHGAFTRKAIMHMEDAALSAALPRLEELLTAMEVEPYVSSPIISDKRWEEFSRMLPVYSSLQAQVLAARL